MPSIPSILPDSMTILDSVISRDGMTSNSSLAPIITGNGSETLHVICAWPVSGQYGPGTRVLWVSILYRLSWAWALMRRECHQMQILHNCTAHDPTMAFWSETCWCIALTTWGWWKIMQILHPHSSVRLRSESGLDQECRVSCSAHTTSSCGCPWNSARHPAYRK